MGEKVCSDFGYVIPAWIETKVNKYLITHSEEYSQTLEKIRSVNLASIYKQTNKNDISSDSGAKTMYDAYKNPSIWAVDHLPFKGLEEILDVKKFSQIMKQINYGKFQKI